MKIILLIALTSAIFANNNHLEDIYNSFHTPMQTEIKHNIFKNSEKIELVKQKKRSRRIDIADTIEIEPHEYELLEVYPKNLDTTYIPTNYVKEKKISMLDTQTPKVVKKIQKRKFNLQRDIFNAYNKKPISQKYNIKKFQPKDIEIID